MEIGKISSRYHQNFLKISIQPKWEKYKTKYVKILMTISHILVIFQENINISINKLLVGLQISINFLIFLSLNTCLSFFSHLASLSYFLLSCIPLLSTTFESYRSFFNIKCNVFLNIAIQWNFYIYPCISDLHTLSKAYLLPAYTPY